MSKPDLSVMGKSIVWVLLLGSMSSWAFSQSQSDAEMTIEQVIPKIERWCGACHEMPHPKLLPKQSWLDVIDIMADMGRKRLGGDFLSDSDIRTIKAFYYGTAPQALPRLPYFQNRSAQLQFVSSAVSRSSKIPQILCIEPGTIANKSVLLVCDGEQGAITLLERTKDDRSQWSEKKIAEIDIPIKVQTIDYDNDGAMDVLASDLGKLPPSSELAGKVHLLRQNDRGGFDKITLLENVGRISDAVAVDIDADGDLDIAISMFGGGYAGEVFWFENIEGEKFKRHPLIDMGGPLNITPTDFNKDGLVDFVSFVTQENEMIIALINQGGGRFKQHNLVRAGHPMFGGTSMAVVDLDGDNDMDIVFTNGDAFDTQTDPKPYHGVQWLENLGDMTFAARDIGRFYGASNTAHGDLDGDGDIDIVASSIVNYWDDAKRQSLVWFENDGAQDFTARPVEGNHNGIVALALEDFTGNGRIDILAGGFRMDVLNNLSGRDDEALSGPEKDYIGQLPLSPRILLFENQKIKEDL